MFAFLLCVQMYPPYFFIFRICLSFSAPSEEKIQRTQRTQRRNRNLNSKITTVQYGHDAAWHQPFYIEFVLLETSQSHFYLFICLFQTKRSDNVQHPWVSLYYTLRFSLSGMLKTSVWQPQVDYLKQINNIKSITSREH